MGAGAAMRATNAAPLEKNSKFWNAHTEVAGSGWAMCEVHRALNEARTWRTMMWMRARETR